MRALSEMMESMAADSVRDGQRIKDVYRDYLDLLFLHEYTDLEGALANGGLAPLPPHPERFNLAPRLGGAHPLGEMDLDNQQNYIAARPATIGALLEIASRVESGPLEVTSMVRHGEYQESLRGSNPNATTEVPTHTMGLAVDIAVINTPLETVYELRDVLLEMRAAGDILFIGERRQLVFHVVPHPSRIGYFTEVYTRAFGTPLTSRAAEVVAPSDRPLTPVPTQNRPEVTTEVLAVLPADSNVVSTDPEEPTGTSGAVQWAPSWSAPAPVSPLVRAARWGVLALGLVAALSTVVARHVQSRQRGPAAARPHRQLSA